MKATLYRYEYADTHTRGVLIVGNILLHTLELADRNNAPNVSCIPTGDYSVNYLPRSGSGKWQRVYHITNVPYRSGILIHTGNVTSQIQGCILVGMEAGYLANKPAVLQSQIAMNKLRQEIGTNSFTLEVRDYGRYN